MKFYKITLYQGMSFHSELGRYIPNVHLIERLPAIPSRNLTDPNGFTCVWWRESKADAEALVEQMKKLWDGEWWEKHVGPQNPQGVVTETMNGYPEITEVEIPTDKKGLFEFIEINASCEYDTASTLVDVMKWRMATDILFNKGQQDVVILYPDLKPPN